MIIEEENSLTIKSPQTEIESKFSFLVPQKGSLQLKQPISSNELKGISLFNELKISWIQQEKTENGSLNILSIAQPCSHLPNKVFYCLSGFDSHFGYNYLNDQQQSLERSVTFLYQNGEIAGAFGYRGIISNSFSFASEFWIQGSNNQKITSIFFNDWDSFYYDKNFSHPLGGGY